MVELTETGIDDLDRILGGGLVRNSTTLVSGNPGTGKSILGLQFVYNGVTEFDERGIYLTFEEDASDLRQAAESLGFDRWAELVADGEILVHDKRELLQENDLSATVDLLLEDLEADDYDRLVLDSLTMFQLFFEDQQEKRTYLLKFSDILQDNGLTSLFVNEQGGMFPETEVGLENFLTEGNIYLIQAPTEGGVNRYVWVAKMRKRDIETDIFPMEIGEGGITVHETAAGFSTIGEESGLP